MKLKKLLLALKIGFLLAIFGAATFYFQYTALKNAYMVFSTNKQATEKTTGSLPLAEEETKTQNSSMEEEEERSEIDRLEEIAPPVDEVVIERHRDDGRECHSEKEDEECWTAQR